MKEIVSLAKSPLNSSASDFNWCKMSYCHVLEVTKLTAVYFLLLTGGLTGTLCKEDTTTTTPWDTTTTGTTTTTIRTTTTPSMWETTTTRATTTTSPWDITTTTTKDPPVQGCFEEGECRDSFAVGISHPGSTNACHDYCRATAGCNYFTYYTDEDTCILFNDCVDPSPYSCSDCVTAAVRLFPEKITVCLIFFVIFFRFIDRPRVQTWSVILWDSVKGHSLNSGTVSFQVSSAMVKHLALETK